MELSRSVSGKLSLVFAFLGGAFFTATLVGFLSDGNSAASPDRGITPEPESVAVRRSEKMGEVVSVNTRIIDGATAKIVVFGGGGRKYRIPLSSGINREATIYEVAIEHPEMTDGTYLCEKEAISGPEGRSEPRRELCVSVQ